MEEVTKCRYVDCADARDKEQILHELPVCDIGLCVKWLINSGHVDLVGRDLDVLRSMKFFLCNNHFTEDCYLSKGTLKETAIPSPHWTASSRTLSSSPGRGRHKIRVNGEGDSVGALAATVAPFVRATATKTATATATTTTTTGEATMSGTATTTTIARAVEKNGLHEFETDQWCRTCATKKVDLVSMMMKGKGTEMSLLSKLKLLIEIDEEDALPTKMCNECVVKLEQSFKFFQQIYVADNALRRIFSKAEIDEVRRDASRRETAKKISGALGERAIEMSRDRAEPWAIPEEVPGRDERPLRIARGGFFRRGRGRPRSRRGVYYPARSRGRPPRSSTWPRSRSNPTTMRVPIPASLPSPRGTSNVDDREDSGGAFGRGEEQPQSGNTIFSLLVDTGCNDDELDWSDVLKLMNLTESAASKEPTVQVDGENARRSPSREDRSTIRCEFCSGEFKFRRQLRTHLLADHSRLSEYMCSDCLACYKSSAMLAKHRALRHENRRYRCNHCQEEFTEKRRLRKHLTECEADSRAFRDSRFSCDFCASLFPSKPLLVQHLKNHSQDSTLTSLATSGNESSQAARTADRSVLPEAGEISGLPELCELPVMPDEPSLGRSCKSETVVNPDWREGDLARPTIDDTRLVAPANSTTESVDNPSRSILPFDVSVVSLGEREQRPGGKVEEERLDLKLEAKEPKSEESIDDPLRRGSPKSKDSRSPSDEQALSSQEKKVKEERGREKEEEEEEKKEKEEEDENDVDGVTENRKRPRISP